MICSIVQKWRTQVIFFNSKYYVPKVESKDFNVLIDGKSFFDVLVKNKEEALEKIMSISKTNDYRTGNLLDYEYFSKHYQFKETNWNRKS